MSSRPSKILAPSRNEGTTKVVTTIDVRTLFETTVNGYADAADHRGSKPGIDQRKSAASAYQLI